MSAKRESTFSPPLPKKPKRGLAARIDPAAKAALAEEIVLAGVAVVQSNAESTAHKTGLSPQQIRKQLADNRANLRRVLVEFAKSVE